MRPVSVGLGQIPGGAALLYYDVRFHTTTELTPAQIHALGLAEVTRIEAEFARVQAAVHFTGTLQEFFAHVRADPKEIYVPRSDHPRLRGRPPKNRRHAAATVRMSGRAQNSRYGHAGLVEALAGQWLLRAGRRKRLRSAFCGSILMRRGSASVQRDDHQAARGPARAPFSDLHRPGTGRASILPAFRFHERLRRRLGAVFRVVGQ